jgi:hypothetical protein
MHIFSPKLCLSALCVTNEHIRKYSTLYQCSEKNLRHIFLSKLSLYFAKLIRNKIPLKTLSLLGGGGGGGRGEFLPLDF